MEKISTGLQIKSTQIAIATCLNATLYIREQQARDEAEGLSEDEAAIYDALANNESTIDVMGNDSLKVIAAELVNSLKSNAWAHRESARARMRVLVKRILRKYGYPQTCRMRLSRQLSSKPD